MKSKVKDVFDIATIWIKKHPTMLNWFVIAFISVYMQWIIIGVSVSPVQPFSMEALSGVLTTSAEVVAGLYGLTLTGYIFFLDRLQQKADDDELLEDIIALLKKRYHNTCELAIQAKT